MQYICKFFRNFSENNTTPTIEQPINAVSLGCENCPHKLITYPHVLEQRETCSNHRKKMIKMKNSRKRSWVPDPTLKSVEIVVVPDVKHILEDVKIPQEIQRVDTNSQTCVCGRTCGQRLKNLHENLLEFCPDRFQASTMKLDTMEQQFGKMAVQEEIKLMEFFLEDMEGKPMVLQSGEKEVIEIE